MPGSVNNAKLQHMTDRQWEDVITDNLTAVFNAFKACLPKMYPNSNIVVVGSIVGSTGGFGCSNYAAAKAGLMGLVRGVANELACLNVRINLLELGYIDCGMGKRLDEKVKTKVIETIPLKRFGTVEDFLTAVDYLCQTKYMTGNTLTLAGGLR
jgi:NAD(P)-dependent dehydrogenase (short-subunit alcohol dehydrogenase family)